MKSTVPVHPSLTLVADTAKLSLSKKMDKKREPNNDTPIDVQSNTLFMDADAAASSIDVGALPHYAASTLQQPHVLSDATTASGATTASVATAGISPLVWIGGALLVGGGVALAAGGGGGGGSTTTPSSVDTTPPVFSSLTTASVAENTSITTTVYKATADNDVGVTYSLGGTDAALFTMNSTTGAVTFKTSPNYEAPSDNGTNNTYDFTVTATDTVGNQTSQAVALSVTNVLAETISLGTTYGNLIAMTSVDGKLYYAWDLNGDGKISADQNVNGQFDSTGAVVNASGSGYQYDLVSHDVLDTIFGGNTTNTAHTVTLNGVQVALPTTGTGNTSETSDYFLSDNNSAYTDMAKIWDTNNSGAQTSGYPSEWTAANPYWTATPTTAGHAVISLDNGYIASFQDGAYAYVALQVL
ncbi:MAG: cadherin repeat domain-containing protein [Sulfuricurvum sp.]